MKQISTSAMPDNDDAPTLTQGDFSRARFRVAGQDVPRKEWQAAVQETLGKQRVNIMLDASVIAFFKSKAGERGYQTLINQALHDVMRGSEIEATLRRVIREELHPAR